MSYRATQDASGTWTIHDVEIFGVVPAGERGLKTGVDREWLEKCADLHRAEFAAGYLPPVHLTHHGADGESRPKVGHFVVTRVGEWRGEPCLFADLCMVSSETMADLESGKWPYRSVEVATWDEPRLSSLALLSSQPPHFRFPLLVPAPQVPEWTAPEGSASPLAAYSHIGNGLVACFKFEPEVQPVTEAEEKPADEKSTDEEPVKAAEAEETPEAEGETDEKSEAPAVPEWATGLSAGINRLLDLIDPERQRAASAAQDVPVSPPADPVQMAAVPPAAAMSETAKLAGENVALKFAARRAETEAAEAAIVADAVTQLGAFGLTDAEKADIRGLAKFGREAVDMFVRTVKSRAVIDPPKSLDAALASAAVNEIDPPEVLRFGDRGPDALERARRSYGQWKQLTASGFRQKLSEFLETQVK